MSYIDWYHGKDVLVTGGTGSIGSKIVKQLVKAGVNVAVLSRDESKQADLRTASGGIHFIIGDIRDKETVEKAVRKRDVVIHAAAMKHVDKCNEFPNEAIKTNVIGSMNVQSASVQARVGTCIVISTDKASEPRGVLGLTKRLTEHIFLTEYAGITEVKIARFGNVMGSRGSVAEIFKRQRDAEQKITVTDPDMFRFYMTPDQAADLVLWSGPFAPARSISTNVMRSATVRDLLSAFDISKDRIEIIGQRPGEKFSEQLIDDDELPRTAVFNYGTGMGNAVAVIYPNGSTGTDIKKVKDIISLSRNHMTISELKQMLEESGVLP
jgi:UDP-N-acetylglucosamine 4,6-dehydratase